MNDTIKIVLTAIQQFGFPLVVAVWALWRLDRNWTKSEGLQGRLDEIDDALERIELNQNKQAEIQQEMLVTMRLYTQIVNNNIGGGNR